MHEFRGRNSVKEGGGGGGGGGGRRMLNPRKIQFLWKRVKR